MLEEDARHGDSSAEELLRRALLDESSSVAVSLKVGGLPLSEAVTVIFHGRRDLGTLQTYVARGQPRRPARRSPRASCCASRATSTSADAEDRAEAERLYIEQATALRDALVGADVVLDVWREPLGELLGSDVSVDHSVELSVRLPAPRLLPDRADRARVAAASSRRCAARGRSPRAGRRWASRAPSRT